MHIRPALTNDAVAACEVLRRSITDLCEADHGNNPAVVARWLANKTPDNVAAWIDRPDNTLLVAVQDDRILAVGSVTEAGEITLNYVLPDARFAGVSRAMLAALERRAREGGNARCHLLSSETARRFYHRNGYAEDGPPEGKFGTRGSYPMSKALVPRIRTARLLLRPWTDEDFPAYAALNADPEVRRWWPEGTLGREDSDAQARSLRRHIEAHGFGFWAVEVPGIAPFIGFVGLEHVGADLPFAPAVEAGWRLARAHWGRGYAVEAASASVADGFDRLGLAEVVAYAVAGNLASRRVMERIGMRHDPASDFHHPGRAEDDPFRHHVVYRRRRPG